MDEDRCRGRADGVASVARERVRDADASGGEPVRVVREFRDSLSVVDVAGLSDEQRVELVAELERVKGASSAAQARLVQAMRQSRGQVAPQDVARSVGSEVALARREPPSCGDRFVRVSAALLEQMPLTLQALSDGVCSETHVVRLVEATSCLSSADRGVVDSRLGPLLGRLGVKAADRAARRVAAELDAAAVVARMEAAVRSRRVTMRAAADGMAYLTVLGPLTEVAGAHAALTARARTVTAGHAPEEPHLGRAPGAVAADTALRVLSGRKGGEVQPVEVHLVMTDRALLGTGDPQRSVWEPARVPGHGSLPAPVARWWLRDHVDAMGAVDAGQREARVWLRRLYTSPGGRDLVSMDSRRRVFTGLLRRMLVLRDDLCTTPHCGAAIVHADHATPSRDGGATSYVEGNGKCARCNQTKEAPGWATEVLDGHVAPGAPSPPAGAVRRLVVRTPLGRVYESSPPPLLGWGSPDTGASPPLPVERRADPAETTRWGGSVPCTPGYLAERVASAPAPTDGRLQMVAVVTGRRGRGKRRLCRPRLTRRPPIARRPRVTSHLERELCRYLT